MPGKIHGMCNKRIYKIYHGMLDRCRNPNNDKYAIYGGKGITVCEEWKSDFMNFYHWAINNGYEDRLSIDRIDSDGNYCPENCRWADYKTQNNNTSRNRLLTYNGKTKTMSEWSDELNIPYARLNSRINNSKMTLDEAFRQEIMNNATRGKEIKPKTVAFGERKYLYQWAADNNMNPTTITNRVKRGMSIEDAISTRKKQKMPKSVMDNIFSDYYAGMSNEDLESKYGISSSSLCRYRQRYNMPKRDASFCYINRKTKHGY